MSPKKLTTLNLLVFVVLVAISLPSAMTAQRTTKVLFNFNTPANPGGSGPQGGLVLDKAGNLYGVTLYGGTGSGDDCLDGGIYGCGTAFELVHHSGGGWTETVLHNFGDLGDGAGPAAAMIFDSKGNLYGTTSGGGAYGCGTVFELTPESGGSWSENILHSFCSPGGIDGSYPYSTLVFDSAGNLYGTTGEGGTGQCACGIAFELSPEADGNWSEKILYNFGSSSGGTNPLGGLVVDKAGNLYGTTGNGGSSCYYGFGCGVVFELTPGVGGTWTEKVLYVFDSGEQTTYGNPNSTLVSDSDGNLYGTTFYAPGVFKLKPNSDGSWTETNIPVPCCYPNAVTLDSKGNLYGSNLSSSAAVSCCGNAFELTPHADGKWTESFLHKFNNAKYGSSPSSSLVFDNKGNLYGTTSQGGIYQQEGEPTGTVFEIVGVSTPIRPARAVLQEANDPF